MPDARQYRRRATDRDFRFFSDPSLWPHYSFLPLSRRVIGSSEVELGVLYDAYGVSGTAGHRCTVFLRNLFMLSLVFNSDPSILAPHPSIIHGFSGVAPAS